MPEYQAIDNCIIPTRQSNIRFAKDSVASILVINGVCICNDRRGLFVISEETRDKYFKLAAGSGTTIGKNKGARGTKRLDSALKIKRQRVGKAVVKDRDYKHETKLRKRNKFNDP